MSSLPTSLLQICDKTQYSLFHALEFMRLYNDYIKMEKLTRQQFREIKDNQLRKLTPYANQLMNDAQIQHGHQIYAIQQSIDAVQKFWDVKHPGEYRIFIFSKYSSEKKPVYKSSAETYNFPILLYLNDNNHFDGIKTLGPTLGVKFYCLSCECSYYKRQEHSITCTSNCLNCRRIGPTFPCAPILGCSMKCPDCNIVFKNPGCFNEHLQRELCKKFQKCPDCGVIYSKKDNERDGRDGHCCGETFCRTCNQWHPKEVQCLIKPLKLRSTKAYRIIAYDFESTQDRSVGTTKRNEEIFQHVPNFISAFLTSSDCIDDNTWADQNSDCSICGPNRTFTWAPFEFQQTSVHQHFTSADPIEAFAEFLMSLDPKYTTYAFSHYGGRYDMSFMIGQFLKLRQSSNIPLPQCIRNGHKLLEIRLKKSKTTPETILRDSFNLMPVKLSQLVKAFGLTIEDKQYFPHGFNSAKNYENVLPHLPPRETYFPDVMKAEELAQFKKFYSNPQNFNCVFDLKEKLAEYCTNDTNILIHALVGLRQEFLKISKRPGKPPMDILHDAMTIASAAIKLWAANYLENHKVALVPERGYNSEDNQSAIAKKWLAWFGFKNVVNVQTAESIEGEYHVKRPDGRDYQLDGFVARPGHPNGDLGLEVHGCRYHGCLKCFPSDTTPLIRDRKTGKMKTAGELRAEDSKRLNFLRQHMEIQVKWTCEIEKECKRNPEMDRFFRGYRTPGAIRVRDAFFGGRTGPFKMYARESDSTIMSYKDFTSLYPWTNFITLYPLNHPKLIKIQRHARSVNWTNSSQNPYKGILQVLILPPQNIKVPFVPMKLDPNRSDSRLLFPLCRACALKYPDGGRMKNYNCTHPPLRRAFLSTITHLELNCALDHGYRVLQLYKVLNYDDWTDQLFKGYISEFMAMKIHATGFPDWCIDDATKDQYVRECWEKFQIRIEKEKMIANPALRFLAKLLLNSLWGRFSLRNNLTKSVIVDTPEELEEIVSNESLECSPPKLILGDEDDGDEIYMISYKMQEEFIEENKFSNVVISLFTTSAARIELYRALNKVANTPGCELLYCDTDSVIYSHPENLDPLPAGKGHLGEMTDETPNHRIEEFVCAGCKNYGMKLRKRDGSYDHTVKIRGFPLNSSSSAILNYEVIKNSVFNFKTPNQLDPIPIHYPRSLRPNVFDGTVYTVPQTKQYQVVITKGIVDDDDLTILPYGYRKY